LNTPLQKLDQDVVESVADKPLRELLHDIKQDGLLSTRSGCNDFPWLSGCQVVTAAFLLQKKGNSPVTAGIERAQSKPRCCMIHTAAILRTFPMYALGFLF
jgi:hypothetical protein